MLWDHEVGDSPATPYKNCFARNMREATSNTYSVVHAKTCKYKVWYYTYKKNSLMEYVILASSTYSLCASADLKGASPHRTSSAGLIPPLQGDAPVDRSGRDPILWWCHRWWHSPGSGTRRTLSRPFPQTQGYVSRKECTACSALVLGPW